MICQGWSGLCVEEDATEIYQCSFVYSDEYYVIYHSFTNKDNIRVSYESHDELNILRFKYPKLNNFSNAIMKIHIDGNILFTVLNSLNEDNKYDIYVMTYNLDTHVRTFIGKYTLDTQDTDYQVCLYDGLYHLISINPYTDSIDKVRYHYILQDDYIQVVKSNDLPSMGSKISWFHNQHIYIMDDNFIHSFNVIDKTFQMNRLTSKVDIKKYIVSINKSKVYLQRKNILLCVDVFGGIMKKKLRQPHEQLEGYEENVKGITYHVETTYKKTIIGYVSDNDIMYRYIA